MQDYLYVSAFLSALLPLTPKFAFNNFGDLTKLRYGNEGSWNEYSIPTEAVNTNSLTAKIF